MPPPPADIQQQSRINAGIVALAAAQTGALWPQVDWGSPAAASAVRKLYGAIVGQFGQSAAAVAAQFYDEQRTAAAVPGQFTAALSDPLPPVMLDKIVTSAFLGGVEPDHTHADVSATTGDLPVEERVPQRLDGSLQRLVLQPGRETIAENTAKDPAPRKPRWIRVPTSPKPCAFCVMMASRDVAEVHGKTIDLKYKSSKSAGITGSGVFNTYHKHCSCVAVPVFGDVADISPNVGDYQDMYYKATADAGTHADTKKILASMRKLHGLK